MTIQACSPPAGYVSNNTDCNDNNGAIHPGATEIPGDEIDQDCDARELCFRDMDGDGYGSGTTFLSNDCDCHDYNESTNSLDCDDNNSAVHIGATEICDGIDNDCDMTIDEGVQATYYRDADGDGYGTATITIRACSAPAGYVSNNSDCDDVQAGIHPNAPELCNGIDDDCDGNIDEGLLTYSFTQDHEICQGETYYWQGNDYNTTGTYTVTYHSVLGCDSTYTLHLLVNPGYDFTEEQLIGDGESYYWQGNNYTATGVYTANYITVKGCDSTYILNLTVHGYTISGKTRYAGKANSGNPAPNPPSFNQVMYNIDNVIVILKSDPAGSELARDTSDASGNYHFANIMNGNYKLCYDKYTIDSMQWVNGVDAIDVTLLKYFIGIDTLVDPSRNFGEKYRFAANVDNNTAINAIDISRIKAKIGSPYILGKNFPRGNWVAMDTLISVAGSDLAVTLKTLGYGDYNASSTKYRDSVLAWNMTKSVEQNIIVPYDEDIITTASDYFEIPLRISVAIEEFSAMGLELTYPENEFKLVSVSMPKNNNNSPVKINPSLDEILKDNDDLLVTDEGGIIRVVFATMQYYDVNARDEIIRLGFRSYKNLNSGEMSLNLSGTGVIGDQYGEVNNDAYLMIPKIFIQNNVSDEMFEMTAYPNPFSDEATLTYCIPENGTVRLKVYNAIGDLVSELVNEAQAKGKHTLVYSSENLAAGMYTFKLEFSGANESKSLIIKLIH